jgi:hypothetical protein
MTSLVTVPVTDGKVTAYNASPGTTDLTADIVGYDTYSGAEFTALPAARILDTRTGLGVPKARVGAGQTVTLKVAGAGGLPDTQTSAVALDVTVISPAASGHLIVSADGAPRPSVSSLSFAAGQQVTQLTLSQVINGKVTFYNGSAGPLDLTADVVGFYATQGFYATHGSLFHPLDSVRIMDTRTGLGGAGETVLPHAAAGIDIGYPALPLTAAPTAVVLNVTVLDQQRPGVLSVFGDPMWSSLPGTPNLAFTASQPASNLVVVPSTGVDFYNNSSGNIQIVVDIEGYYTQ